MKTLFLSLIAIALSSCNTTTLTNCTIGNDVNLKQPLEISNQTPKTQ